MQEKPDNKPIISFLWKSLILPVLPSLSVSSWPQFKQRWAATNSFIFFIICFVRLTLGYLYLKNTGRNHEIYQLIFFFIKLIFYVMATLTSIQFSKKNHQNSLFRMFGLHVRHHPRVWCFSRGTANLSPPDFLLAMEASDKSKVTYVLNKCIIT